MKVLVAETQRMVPIGNVGPPLVDAGLELVNWRVDEDLPPASLSDFDGVVALGGAANPDEDGRFPWLGKERELLAEAVERRLPTIGLCLGAQLLAQVLGAPIERLSRPEIGWFELSQSGWRQRDPLCAPLPERLHVFEWHSYGFRLPPGATLLAGNGQATQAFSWGGHAWGLQFHLEADEGIVDDWIAHYEDELRLQEIDPGRLALETRYRAPLYRRCGETLARHFASRVSRFASARNNERSAT